MFLFKRYFREELPPLAAWGITLFLTGLVLALAGLLIDKMQIAESLKTLIQKMPPAVRKIFGGTMFVSFSTLYLLGMAYDTIAPILLVVFTSLSALGLYTREAGQGNLEFLFSLPIDRFTLIAQRILVFLLDLALLHLLFALGVAVGSLAADLRVEPATLTWATLALFLLSFCVSGLAYLLSLSTNDYGRGLLVVLGVLLGLLLLELGLGDAKNLLLGLNPFHHLDAARIFMFRTAPWRAMLGFTLAGLVLWGMGIGIYVRKQI